VSPWSTEIREARSWLSEDGGVETPEPSERVLAEGERYRFCACGFWAGGTAGDKDFPLPSTLPPPRVLLDMFLWQKRCHEVGFDLSGNAKAGTEGPNSVSSE
jgi:hypothetical protein